MKVLLSAYNCLPGAGSESGLGWNWAQCIAADGHRAVVITRTVNQPKIVKFLESHPDQPLRFVFHDLSPLFQRVYKLPFGNYVYYLFWQWTAAKLALKLHLVEGFDQVQHLTWASFRVPSFMGTLGIPFTFGPVGGGEDTPRKLRSGLGWRGQIWDGLRRASNSLMAPTMGFTFESATEIIATTKETLSRIPKKYRHKTKVSQSIGVDLKELLGGPSEEPQKSLSRDSSRLELLYVGRLLPWKGLHLLLKAMALLDHRKSSVHLTIIGSGRDLQRLQRMSHRLNLDEIVSWVPWMPRDELIRTYENFDLFMFPSLHDSGGLAVLEALAFGLPVVCLDLGGPGMAVDNSCGHVVGTAASDEADVVKEMTQFVVEILTDRGLLRGLSESARARAGMLTWQANVRLVYGK